MYRCTCEENMREHIIICSQQSFTLVAAGVEKGIPTSDPIFEAKQRKNTTLSVLTLPTLIYTKVQSKAILN